jgi:glycosyltransferase involved in cell wall biosynthesis
VSNSPRRFTPSCTVVVCTRERPESLNACLEALSALDYPCFEVLVVNNGRSNDATDDIASRWGARYAVEHEVGLSRARNRGARLCNTELVAFLDDDAVPEPDWLTKLVNEFRDPAVIVVTGRMLPLREESGLEAQYEAAMAGSVAERRVVDRSTPAWFELANFGGIGDGGSMAFRRAAFDVWPGFDERLGRGAALDASEEHYAFFCLLDLGYRAAFTPDAIGHHPLPRTLADLRTRRLRDLTASTAYFTFLFAEQPRYRWRVLKYVLEAVRGEQRKWRRDTGGQARHPVPVWRALRACVNGPVLYAKLRLFDRRWKDALPGRGAVVEPRSGLVPSIPPLSGTSHGAIGESPLEHPGLSAQ